MPVPNEIHELGQYLSGAASFQIPKNQGIYGGQLLTGGNTLMILAALSQFFQISKNEGIYDGQLLTGGDTDDFSSS
jgi:hypothetical protein